MTPQLSNALATFTCDPLIRSAFASFHCEPDGVIESGDESTEVPLRNMGAFVPVRDTGPIGEVPRKSIELDMFGEFVSEPTSRSAKSRHPLK